jgi:hypothetical protein
VSVWAQTYCKKNISSTSLPIFTAFLPFINALPTLLIISQMALYPAVSGSLIIKKRYERLSLLSKLIRHLVAAFT